MSVFITGATAGIGEATARAFAAVQRDLVLAARRKDRLDALGAELRTKFGVQVTCFELDVQNRESVEALVQKHPEVISRVEVLINNAGLAIGREPFQEGTPEDWEAMIDTNFKGLLAVTRAILPSFLARKAGHIVNLGSAAGRWTYPNGNVYSATKYAVHGLSESLRLDLSGTGIRVTEVSPGMVETEFSEVRFRGDRDKAKAVYAGMTPLKAQDIAEAIVWAVLRPAHVNIQEIVLFPTDQASVTTVHRR